MRSLIKFGAGKRRGGVGEDGGGEGTGTDISSLEAGDKNSKEGQQ